MEQPTFTLLLDYLYSKFAVTFILCIIGVVIKVIITTVNNKQRVSIGKLIASTMFSTFLMCAIGEYIHINFSIYVLLSVVVGMWSTNLVALFLNSKFMSNLTLKYLKKVAGPVAKSISEALDEEDTGDKQDGSADKTKSIEEKPESKDSG